MTCCMVIGCGYLAESSIEDFQVCLLHDHPNVRAILERLEVPGAFFWSSGHPIVLPCGALEEKHLIAHEAEGLVRACDAVDWPMLEAPSGSADVVEAFRL